MKYNLLTSFRVYLNETIPNQNTSNRYFFAVQKVLKDFDFEKLSEISQDELEQKLSVLKTKNDFSATKNGLKYLAQFNSDFNLPSDEFFKTMSLKKRNWNQRPP